MRRRRRRTRKESHSRGTEPPPPPPPTEREKGRKCHDTAAKEAKRGEGKIKGIRDARAEMGSGWRERKKVPSPSPLTDCPSYPCVSAFSSCLFSVWEADSPEAKEGPGAGERRSSMFQVWKSTNIWQNKSIPTAKLRGLCL